MNYQDSGARLNTCPECGHYGWAHGKHGCVVLVYNTPKPGEQQVRLCCPCIRSRESFIEKAFDACWRI